MHQKHSLYAIYLLTDTPFNNETHKWGFRPFNSPVVNRKEKNWERPRLFHWLMGVENIVYTTNGDAFEQYSLSAVHKDAPRYVYTVLIKGNSIRLLQKKITCVQR